MIIHNKNTEIISENNIIKIIILLILAMLLSYTNMSENVITPVIIIITAISIMIGSIFSSIKIRKQGIINGAIVGSIYMVTIYILSSILYQNFSMSTNTIIMIVAGILAGATGGIIGVNLKQHKRQHNKINN